MTKKLAALALMAGVMALAARPAAAQGVAGGSDPAFQQQAAPATAPTTSPVTTQAPASTGDAPANAVARFGPTLDGAKLLAPATTQEQRKVAHEPAYRRSAPGVALMIVGGALFLGGAIVGERAGDALMVAGVVVAAVGLFQYLQ